MNMNVNQTLEPIDVYEPESDKDSERENIIEQGSVIVDLTPEQHGKILKYLLDRLDKGNQKRIPRIQRFARIDQMIATWQKLSPEDTIRETREDSTGRLQALPINLPITQAHVEDAVSFFAEVFAPVGGNFFANPGKKAQITTVKALVSKMEQDMKQSSYYAGVVSAMNALTKYNVGGYGLEWIKKSRLDESDGNVLFCLDMYNFLYDPSVKDVSLLHKNGEWSAYVEVQNRLWLIRQAEKSGLMNLDNIFGQKAVEGGQKMESYIPGKAKYYKNPPSQTKMPEGGEDSATSLNGAVDDNGVDWEGYGMGLKEDGVVDIEGYEVVTVYAWVNPDQFDLDRQDTSDGKPKSLVELWKFRIVDSAWIISAEAMGDAIELPTYMSRMRKDEMNEAMRSLAEFIRPFQRFISFLLNTHVEGIRKNVWGKTVYDPVMIDPTTLKPGETSGLIALKKSGDVRMAIQSVDTAPDTFQNIQTAGEVMNLMKNLFPNQAMPSQIAGMDRAVTSQVSAVMQGAMRRMHMLVRAMDSSLMLPVRMGMYRNIALYDPNKSDLRGIKPEEVAEVLSGGLGQINREAAAEQLRTLIFAIIQNPEGNEAFDVPGLMQLWSILMNVGTDLGEFYRQPANPTSVDPAAAGGAELNPAGVAAGMPAGI